MDHVLDWLKLAAGIVAGIFGAWIASLTGLLKVSRHIHDRFSKNDLRFAGIETKFAEIDTAFAKADGHMEKQLRAARHEVLGAVQTQFAGPLSDEVRREYSEMRNDIRALAATVSDLRSKVEVLLDRDKRQ